METYDAMRRFADSWALLAMVAFFIGAVFWAYRPGGRKNADDAADIPFKNYPDKDV